MYLLALFASNKDSTSLIEVEEVNCFVIIELEHLNSLDVIEISTVQQT